MYECARCGCLVDANEIHNGICIDCMEYEEQQEIQREINRQMRKQFLVEQDDGQLVCNL